MATGQADAPSAQPLADIGQKLEDVGGFVLLLKDARGNALGSAFGIGPRVALTCHHCIPHVPAGEAPLLVVPHDTDGPGIRINEVVVSPDPHALDMALLLLADELPAWLPVSERKPRRFDNLTAFGFPEAMDTAVRIDVESRGLQAARYGDYVSHKALVLAGDPATHGMSGGPVIDTEAGVVVAMIVGGPHFNQRTIAIPFHAVDALVGWPALRLAVMWNMKHSAHWRWAMNHVAAGEMCSALTRKAIERSHTFEADRFVARRAAIEAHARFLAGEQSTLLISGPPNIGKSSVLSGFAMGAADHALLFDAFRMGDCSIPFVEHVDAVLRGDAKADGVSLALLAQAWAAEQVKLVVYLDGINEIATDGYRIKTWFANAMEDCARIGVKLVASCRSDVLENMGLDTHSFVSFRLGEFSGEEAELALQRYGLPALAGAGLKRHPLLFRIASELPARERRTDLGWYRMMTGFVRRLVGRAPGMPAHGEQGVLRAVERIAAKLEGFDENMPWDFVAVQLGGSAEVDRLISAGLFRAHDHSTVRFTFDEIGEALRPCMDGDTSELANMWRRSWHDSGLQRRLVGSVLRAHAENDLARVGAYLDSLMLASEMDEEQDRYLDDTRLLQLGEVAAAITAGLPDAAALSDQVFELYLAAVTRSIAQRKTSWTYRLETQIAQSGFTLRHKAGLLVAALPFCGDDGLRLKDLAQPEHEQRLLAAAREQDTIAGAILRLVQEDTRAARSVLLPRVHDTRRLMRNGSPHGEVTVGEVISFILTITAPRDFPDIVSRLLRDPADRSMMALLRDIACRFPSESLLCALDYLDGASAIAVMNDIVASALQRMGAGRAPLAIIEKLQKIVDSGTASTRTKAAALIRVAVPDDLAAWDVVHSGFLVGESYSLRPVPKARHRAFVTALVGRGDRFALDEIKWTDDPDLQEDLAGAAISIFEARGPVLAQECAYLAEYKLYQCATTADYERWMPFARRLMRSPYDAAKDVLRYFACVSNAPEQYRREIWDGVMASSSHGELVHDWLAFALSRHSEIDDRLICDFVIAAVKSNAAEAMKALGGAAQSEIGKVEVFGRAPNAELRELFQDVLHALQAERHPDLPLLLPMADPDRPAIALFAGFGET